MMNLYLQSEYPHLGEVCFIKHFLIYLIPLAIFGFLELQVVIFSFSLSGLKMCSSLKTRAHYQCRSWSTNAIFAPKCLRCEGEWGERWKIPSEDPHSKGTMMDGRWMGRWTDRRQIEWLCIKEAAQQKNGLTLELSQRGGGVKVQSKVKGALFATDRFPLGSISSYLTPMVVLHFSYIIYSTLEPSLCVGW